MFAELVAFLHIKDYIVKNLCLLFDNIPEVTINNYGSLKNWIQEALKKKYWNDLIMCLLNQQATIPLRPNEWPQPRRSPRNHNAPPPRTNNPFPPHPHAPKAREHPTPPPNTRPRRLTRKFSTQPSPPPDPCPRVDNDPLPRHPKQMKDKTTYLNKWGAASMTP
jgi:hypothetical protein